MHILFAIVYEDETIAGRAAEEFERCAEDLPIDPDAASVVICDRDGRFHLTTGRCPGATVHWSKFWGALLDALVNGEDPSGIEPGFRSWFKAALRPGGSALLLAATMANGKKIVETLTPLGGEAASSPLGDDLPERWGVRGLRFAG